MHVKTILIGQLKRHEGLRFHPYTDTAGKWTIGYGRNLSDNGISEKEALILLEHDIAWAITDARALFHNYDDLCPVRQAVLANMAFNLGKTRLATFRKFKAAIEAEDFITAASEMLNSRWAQQVGQRAEELAELIRYP